MKFFLNVSFLALVTMGAAYAEKPKKADHSQLIAQFKSEVAANQSLVLSIMEKALRQNPDAAGEIVKAAIKATNADAKLVAQMVELVAVNATEQLLVAAKCALAVAPDAAEEVRLVLAKFVAAAADEEEAEITDLAGLVAALLELIGQGEITDGSSPLNLAGFKPFFSNNATEPAMQAAITSTINTIIASPNALSQPTPTP